MKKKQKKRYAYAFSSRLFEITPFNQRLLKEKALAASPQQSDKRKFEIIYKKIAAKAGSDFLQLFN